MRSFVEMSRLALALACAAATWAAATPAVATSNAAARQSATAFDHSAFDRVLVTAVSNGRVDYAKFKASADFAAYIKSLETASVGAYPANEQLAFWINAYNALVIRNVLDNPGMHKPTDVRGFFDAKRFKVAGAMLTLNDIENNRIRAKFKEPLIHFGLVCAARSCPPISNHVFTAANVRSRLASNATAYLASQYNRFDAASNTITLSKILDWYKDDFGGEAGIRSFLKKYGTAAMKQALAGTGTKIGYMEYDWTLNAK